MKKVSYFLSALALVAFVACTEADPKNDNENQQSEQGNNDAQNTDAQNTDAQNTDAQDTDDNTGENQEG